MAELFSRGLSAEDHLTQLLFQCLLVLIGQRNIYGDTFHLTGVDGRCECLVEDGLRALNLFTRSESSKYLVSSKSDPHLGLGVCDGKRSDHLQQAWQLIPESSVNSSYNRIYNLHYHNADGKFKNESYHHNRTTDISLNRESLVLVKTVSVQGHNRYRTWY